MAEVLAAENSVRSMKRLWPGVTIVIALFALGFVVGAHGAKAEGPWDRFTIWGQGSDQQCAGQKATIYTSAPPVEYEPAAYGYTRHRIGTPCDNNDPVPAGHLGVHVTVARGDNTICNVRAWDYNTSSTAVHSAGVIPSNCPNANSLQSVAWGKIWRPAWGTYDDAASGTFSPILNTH